MILVKIKAILRGNTGSADFVKSLKMTKIPKAAILIDVCSPSAIDCSVDANVAG